jgi:hypothetical protein
MLRCASLNGLFRAPAALPEALAIKTNCRSRANSAVNLMLWPVQQATTSPSDFLSTRIESGQ